MDQTKLETDRICMDTANIFRALDALEQQRRELDAKLMQQIKAYSQVSRVWGWTRDHMRQACKARGMLL